MTTTERNELLKLRTTREKRAEWVALGRQHGLNGLAGLVEDFDNVLIALILEKRAHANAVEPLDPGNLTGTIARRIARLRLEADELEKHFSAAHPEPTP